MLKDDICGINLPMRIRKEDGPKAREEIKLIADCSDALAHPARVEIFSFIYQENLERRVVCNKDIVATFDYSQATISQHLNRLVSSGLVEVQPKGNKNLYFVSIGTLGKYVNAIKKLSAR